MTVILVMNNVRFDAKYQWCLMVMKWSFRWWDNGQVGNTLTVIVCQITAIFVRDNGNINLSRKSSRYQNSRKKRHRIIVEKVIRSPKFRFASFSLIERNSEFFPKLWRCLRSIFINIFLELSFFDLSITKIPRYTFKLGESSMVHDSWTIWSPDIGMHWYHSQWFGFVQAA